MPSVNGAPCTVYFRFEAPQVKNHQSMPKIAITFLSLWFLATGIGIGSAATNAASPAYSHTDRLIVRIKSGAIPRQDLSANELAAARERVGRRLQSLTPESIVPLRTMGDGAQVMKLNRRLPLGDINRIAANLARDPDVLEVIPDRLFFPQIVPTDTLYPLQWNLTQANGINMPTAWDISTGSASTIVAVLDTGYLNHADLAGRWIGGYDFVSTTDRGNDGNVRDADALDPGDWVTMLESTTAGALFGCPITDSRWHGTAMAGIIAANANNAGIAGINWSAKLLPVRVVGKCGGYESDIIDGMRWAAGIAVAGVPDNPNVAKILNVSLAAVGACSGAYQSAVNDVVNKGVAVIAAAGNSASPTSNYSPGNCNGVITVGAVDKFGGLPLSYANTGAEIAVSAPGGSNVALGAIATTHDSGTNAAANDSIYLGLTGTSISAAHASGVASLMLAVNPTLKPIQVQNILKYSSRIFPDAVPLGSVANCNTSLCGGGILEATKALQSARAFQGNVPQVAAYVRSKGLRSDGQVFEWATSTITQRSDVASVALLATGTDHTLALRTDGTVWAWGDNGSGNTYGQLGNGTTTNSSVAIAVPGMTGVASISAGGWHSLAAKIDGTVWAWGSNSQGLGNGTIAQYTSPIQVPGLTGVARVASSGGQNNGSMLAQKHDGSVWAWGWNQQGQLGDGTTTDRLSPVPVTGLTNVVAIVMGQVHTLALKSDGTVWAWGYNNAGQLGDGTTTSRSIPAQVPGLANVTAISAGGSHSLALLADGSLWGWGSNSNNQLDDGTTLDRLLPVPTGGVIGSSGVAGIAAGGNFSLVVKTDGSVFRWGNWTIGASIASSPVPVVMLGVGSVGTLNLDPSIMSFTPRTDIAMGTQLTSNAIIVSGIADGSAISVTGGTYRIGAGAFTSVAGTINNGQALTLQQTASANCNTTVATTVTIATLAGGSRSFNVTTIPCDTTPNALGIFATEANVPPGSEQTSNAITITGINGPTPIGVVGGVYALSPCTAGFTNVPGVVTLNQSVCVRQTAAATASTVTSATLTVGPLSTTYHVITATAPGFSTPMQLTGYTTSTGLRSDGTVHDWTTAASSTPHTDISGVTRIAAGSSHTLALRNGGNVWVWGSGTYGMLGDGTTASSASARPVPGFNDVVSIAAGSLFSLAVKADGTVWAWGDGASGKLGDGTAIDRLTPVPVSALTGVARVASFGGASHALALKTDGTVWAWGWNSSGQLGDGSTTDRAAPVQVSGLTNVTRIVAGTTFSLALKADGSVWAWGNNANGQLGDGTTTNRLVPTLVSGLNNVVALAAGGAHTMALKSDGSVWAWGQNQNGRLGDGTVTSRLVPTPISALANVAAISAGNTHSLAAKTDGSVYIWGGSGSILLPALVLGAGGAGTLNLNAATTLFLPRTEVALSTIMQSNSIIVSGIANSSAISVTGGAYSIDGGAFVTTAGTINNGQSLTLRQTSSAACATTIVTTITIASLAGGTRDFSVTTVACDNIPNALLDLVTQANVPLLSVRTSNTITVSGINGPTPISVAGGEYAIGFGCTGTFLASGTINNNQTVCVRQTASATPDTLTTATLTVGPLSTPFHVITAPAIALAVPPHVAAYATSNGLRSDGTVFEWNSSANSVVQRADISGVKKLAVGTVHTLALRTDGSVWAWGQNAAGQLGDGTTTGSNAARMVPGIGGMVSIAAGNLFSLAVKDNGTVWAWGDNFYGALGDGTSVDRLSPVQLSGISGVAQVAAYSLGNFSLALKTDGTVWAWGQNNSAQLGDGTFTNRATPAPVTGLNNVTALAAGSGHSLALKADGTVVAWGGNTYGTLGDGTFVTRSTPVTVAGLTNVIAIAAGQNHSLALKSDGTVWAWGENLNQKLGDGTTINRSSPVQMNGMTNVQAIGAGTTYTMAIIADGSVLEWYGTTVSTAPVLVLGLASAGTLNLDFAAGVFIPRVNMALSASVQSNIIRVSGIANGSAISVSGGQYRIDAGTFTSTPGTINDGQLLALQQTASATCGTTTVVTITIASLAGSTRNFSVTTLPCDNTPNPLADLLTQAHVTPGIARTSNAITVSGINASVAISVVGGEYSIGCTTIFTPTASTIANNQTVCVRQNASMSADTVTNATLSVGSLSTAFRVITAPAPGFTTTPQVFAGVSSALRSDGVVFDWGTNPLPRSDIGGVVKLAATSSNALALRADGIVWARGNNSYGQLGDGTTTANATTKPVPGLTTVAAIAMGGLHGLAAKIDGTVWAWGDNAFGALGNGTQIDSLSPQQVAGLSGVTQVVAGSQHSFAVKTDGTVWAWGRNDLLLLGDGTNTQRLLPVQLTTLNNINGVSVGYTHALALRGDGTVWAWGQNGNGRLGDGTLTNRISPIQVAGLTNVIAISAGYDHSLALKNDGTVWAWGSNDDGQLGDGTKIDRYTPVRVAGSSGIAMVAAGIGVNGSSLAMKVDGTVYQWGVVNKLLPVAQPGVGGVGILDLIVNGLTPDPFSFLPVFGAQTMTPIVSSAIKVSGLGTASPITVTGGEYSINGGAFTSTAGVVVNEDLVRARVMSASGFEALSFATVSIGGAVGQSSTFYVYTRRDPARPASTPAISLGENHSILLNAKGTAFGFGYNGNGQLGNGTTFSTPRPTPVAAVANVLQIASGANHVLALLTDGTLRAWGYNAGGQLGDGSGVNSAVNAVTVAGLGFVKSISAGRDHSLALKADGTVWAWGLNIEGQIGDGSMSSSQPLPLQIAGLANVIAIAAGDRHNLALLASGQVMAWGANESGQLGDGTTIERRVPTTIPGLFGVTSIAAGGAHSLAIKNTGSGWAWGANGFGQLGNASNVSSSVPVQITSLGNTVGLMVAGQSHSMAVISGGALYTWGANANGQLGDGASTARNTPFAVVVPAFVIGIAAGGGHSAAISKRGKLYLWGDNAFGQVGNKSGNYDPAASGTNVLQGNSLISTVAQSAGSSTGTSSSSGSAVLEIAEIATGYDFRTVTLNTTANALGKFKNQALTDDITGIGLSVSGTGFTLQSTDCAMTLTAGNECNFALAFTPTVAGDAVGELQVASSLVGSPERRSLFGTGLAANSPGMKIDATAGETYLAFSPQTIGSVSEVADVSITNTGSAALIVSSVSVTTAAGEFAATSACTTTIAPGATCVLPVTFTPTVSSAINGQLTIASNAGNQVVALSGTGVGNMVGGGLALNGALSQKVHGSAGTFNVTIDIFKSITQAITTEPRSIGSGHVIVFQFSQPVTQPGTATAVDTLDANIGNVASVSAQGNNVFVH